MLKINIGKRRAPKASPTKLFHGVAVEPSPAFRCEAVLAIGAQRFLSEDAPRLPLAACSDPTRCRCVYRHFDDRRTELRRDADIGAPPHNVPEERRDGTGRRVTDR